MVQMSKKSIILPQRPEPPSVEQIVEDVEAVEEDDVIFMVSDRTVQDADSGVMYESFSYEDSPGLEGKPAEGDSLSAKRPRESEGAAASADIDTVYKQAVQFIDVTEKLKLAPEQLRTMCDHLQKIGKDMTESIEELKRQSDVVLKAKGPTEKK